MPTRTPSGQQPASDEQLMQAYLAGDRSAFDEIFRRYAPRVLAMARRRMGCEQAAGDVVQQTFLKLHLARNDFKVGSKLQPWLITIAMNLVRDQGRRARRWRLEELDDARPPTVHHSDAVPVDERRRAELARGAIERLPEPQRRVVHMHWIEERSFGEVARTLGENVSTVKVRAHRAYKLLRADLAERWDPSELAEAV